MGFSVSGSFALLFLALFIVAGIVYPAMANSAERVYEAEDEAETLELNRKNTDISVTSYSYSSNGNDHVRITIKNTGTTALHVDAVTVLVDNEYQTEAQIVSTTVDGDSGTNLWMPGDELQITTDPSFTDPTAFVVITEYDISERREF